jgi:predicted HicB family RNase H-like nuclease
VPKAKKNPELHAAIKARKTLNLSKLSPEERKRVERAINPRNTPFSLRFSSKDIEVWRAAAKAAGESITGWVEKQLNVSVKSVDSDDPFEADGPMSRSRAAGVTRGPIVRKKARSR